MAIEETSANDDALVNRVRAGDCLALSEFLVGRQPQLMAFIERRLGPGLRRKIEPDDLYQEVSAEAVRSLGEVKLMERDPFNWLCQVAERRIIDAHRRFFGSQKRNAGREVSLDAGGGSASTSRPGLINMLVASMTSASQVFSRDQKQIRMLTALEQLPEENREALRLRYLEGMPSKQIAEKLGKTDGAIRVMLTRSLAKLQQILGTDTMSNV
ncbi:MAG TPA: sigma-70 family RNA polymerase sigma factor [Pirellulales bacterium]|jgi:RNA polymerase sigma-70 factor (ECF subfamily)|nr:sigma-70 family RNA polymerase sigma factor [Pirellulales bacterium]